MNRDLITLNEVLNDGSGIYFYQEEMSGAWATYGYSAYHLSQMSGSKTLSGFSKSMQMPCTCISEADFQNIVRKNMSTIECRDGYYYLPTSSKVDDDLYRQWIRNIKL